MKKRKLKVGVVFGGRSAEHEVSLNSAKNVISFLDKTKYLVTPFKINKIGDFDLESIKKFDVVIPILHGPFGEDGSMQGLFKLAGVPFVGAGVLGSAVGMDKDVMKRLLRDAGIPIGKFLTIKDNEQISYETAKKKLGSTIFIKPANMGSSVGVSKAKNKIEFQKGLKEAFKFDNKVILEELITGRELECAVLGNEYPIASVLGEVIPNNDFYSYDAKYVDETLTSTSVALPKDITNKIQALAIKTFLVLGCEGLGRVDFFLKKNGQPVVNEINTLPGFTNISMYPKLWEASGLTQTKLLDRLIDLAIERFDKEQKLQTSVK